MPPPGGEPLATSHSMRGMHFKSSKREMEDKALSKLKPGLGKLLNKFVKLEIDGRAPVSMEESCKIHI